MDNRKKIEHDAILEIQKYFQYFEEVDTSNIAINDKNPAIDGQIEVYDLKEGKQPSKYNLKYSIVIQVKGSSSELSNNKYPVSMSDIRFYLKHTNGVIYFVVSLADLRHPKLLFKKFSPIELKTLDKSVPAKQQKKTIKFKMFPKKPEVLLNIFEDFIEQCKRQTANVLALSDSLHSGTVIKIKVKSKPEYVKETLLSGAYLYRTIVDKESGNPIDIPVGEAEVTGFFKIEKGQMMSPSGVMMRTMTEESAETGLRKVVTGSNGNIIFSVNLHNDESNHKVVIQYTLKGTYIERLKDASFLLEIVGYHPDQSNIQQQKMIKTLQMQIKQLKKTIDDLDNRLMISPEIDPDKLETDQQDSLIKLLQLLNGEFIPSPKYQHITLKIGKSLYGFIVSNEAVINVFSPELVKYVKVFAEKNQNSVEFSPYVTNKNSLECYPNFSGDLILKSFNAFHCYEPKVANYYLLYVLALLNTYDRSDEHKFLELAEKVLNLIEPGLKKELVLINRLQIKIRYGVDLNIDELQSLIDIAKNNENRLNRLSAYVLLKDNVGITEGWNKLTSEEKLEFHNWPIVNLSSFKFSLSK
ncbi:hypothetical protein [Loigolactobacillus bifermentans]|uniref:DUF4365 domain-containing protein n=1 Tax=Loigolactobacillus bifermentans DSM 20003 TaxID=1423726 RepID=A0A0R1H3J1_9LACO|nr:hypothetical protein [Loigolactobacillus bifermentans]KRK39123.1 hypothetical protein FC07_GL002844 [Loigolactobacillus bifermentans DSM 20003]QGG58992.1 hypothetical protein LB003_00165 [Loigolactobacillus bifermentans]